MGITAAHTAPNFAFGNYFRILKAEFQCAPGGASAWEFMVGFYANAEARNLNTDPMYVHNVRLPVGQELFDGSLVEDPRGTLLYPLLMQSPLFGGTNAQPHLQDPEIVPAPE